MKVDDIELRFRVDWPGFALDVNLALPGRGVSVLFGHSGSGKTTLLRCIAGLERAREGFISFKGRVWQDDKTWVPPHQRPMGYVFQEASLFAHLSVLANLRYGMKRATTPQAVSLDHAVGLLGIGHLLDRKTDRLSGGERQRVAIARALLSGPQLLLMDEPLAALDAGRKAEILPYLERLHQELTLPIVYVTHSMDEAARLADHLVLMHAGAVEAAGPLGELMARTDLSLSRQDEAGVVIDAEVAEHDTQHGLTHIGRHGAMLWVGGAQAQPGERVRARVLARDVSVTRQPPGETSILNVLPVVLESVQRERTTALLSLRVSSSPPELAWTLLARITSKSCDALALQPGDALHAQIKGVALM